MQQSGESRQYRPPVHRRAADGCVPVVKVLRRDCQSGSDRPWSRALLPNMRGAMPVVPTGKPPSAPILAPEPPDAMLTCPPPPSHALEHPPEPQGVRTVQVPGAYVESRCPHREACRDFHSRQLVARSDITPPPRGESFQISSCARDAKAACSLGSPLDLPLRCA